MPDGWMSAHLAHKTNTLRLFEKVRERAKAYVYVRQTADCQRHCFPVCYGAMSWVLDAPEWSDAGLLSSRLRSSTPSSLVNVEGRIKDISLSTYSPESKNDKLPFHSFLNGCLVLGGTVCASLARFPEGREILLKSMMLNDGL